MKFSFRSLRYATLMLLSSLMKKENIKMINYLTKNNINTFQPYLINETRIAFLIPAYNEEAAIGQLISTIKKIFPKSLVLVVDNNSKDGTGRIALKSGATVILEKSQGKGYAVKTGFNYLLKLSLDALIMMDGDCTYYPVDAKKLLEESTKGGYGVILGSRIIGIRKKGTLSSLNYIGNLLLTFIANFLYGTTHSDICTGYWLFRPEAARVLLKKGINTSGFALEAEMIALLANNRIITKDIPIKYGFRVGRKSHLKPFKDSIAILSVLLKNRMSRNV